MKHLANISLLFLLSVGCAASDLYAMEKGLFHPPSLDGYTLDRTIDVDKDQVPDNVKETTIYVYKDINGKMIGKYVSNNKTWAWAVLKNPTDRNDTVNNYTLRDSDGNGILNEKYFGDESFIFPDWVKKAENK